MKNYIYLAALFFSVLSYAQSSDQNYIQTTTFKLPMTSAPTGLATPAEGKVDINYYDGLGRPIQKKSFQQGANGGSIATIIEYDGFGRQEKEYLPFIKGDTGDFITNGAAEAADFYYSGDPITTGNPHFDTTGYPYSQKLFENSPLNRVMMQAAPGDDWSMGNGKEVKYVYMANVEDEVKWYTANVDASTTGVYIGGISDDGYYPKRTLYKTITKDENWTSGDDHTTQEFKDKEGHVILKRTFNEGEPHDTYYVYDQYGNLAYVLPPLANGNIDYVTLNGLCYQYRYDHRNRLAEKKLPGKDWEYIIYDALDRPVLTGPTYDPFGDLVIGFMYTKYDVFGRVCFTGWFTYGVSEGSVDLLRSFYSNPANVDNAERDNTTLIGTVNAGYRFNVALPNKFELLTVTYYDDYTFPGNPGNLPSEILGQTLQTNAKGLTTGSWSRIVTTATDESGDTGYTLYDRKARPVSVYSTELIHGYTDKQTQYDFSGQVLEARTLHKKTSGSSLLTVRENFEYSDQGRLIRHLHKINGKPSELLSYNTYDNLGTLVSKRVGGMDAWTGLQKVDFRYNIRGWLTDINRISSLSDDIPDLFAFHINYNQPTNEVLTIEPLFNGNISETFWRTASDNITRAYSYEYDALNRLGNAMYQKPGSTLILGNYDEVIDYDKNGNITHLHRTGNLDNSTMNVVIDDLSYVYQPESPNRLVKVTDSTNDPVGFKDDSDGTNDTAIDYEYDNLGNMIIDQNKDIVRILYNQLNLPVEIQFAENKKINYIYDGAGSKLRKIVFDGTTTTTTDYMSGFQYKNNVLQFFPTAEGYVNYTSSPDISPEAAFNYVYSYKDHLGNIRLNYSKDPGENVLKILEENHYYPFGLKHENYSADVKDYKKEEMQPLGIKPVPVPVGVEYKYRYNSKEWQDELGLNMYDMDMRDYDPAIARWVVMDPVVHYELSPYNTFDNNPVFWADPSGADSEDSFGRTTVENGKYIPVSERGDAGEASRAKQNDTDDIIFKNKKGTEVGRIIVPGKDVEINVGDVTAPSSPLVVDPVAMAKEVGQSIDAVGISIDYSGVIGGGNVGGVDFTYFLNGEDKGKLFGFTKFGGGVGFDAELGISATAAVYNREANPAFLNAKGMEGPQYGLSGGVGISASISWSNEKNIPELYPNQRSSSTWTSYSLGGGIGGEFGAKWFSTTSKLMNNGKPLYKK